MGLHRHAKKRDANEPEIKAEGNRLKCKFIPLDAFDLLMKTDDGRIFMVEVKTPTGRLTEKQMRFLAEGWPLHIVRTKEDLRKLVESEEFVA